MKMTTAQRQELIFQNLETQGFVSVLEMAGRCGVSEMTLRRDLDRLAQDGRLERTHGGAAPVRRLPAARIDLIEPSVDTRATTNIDAKQAIGRTAARLVSAGQAIALDIGTTTFQLACELAALPLSIYTPSLKIAALLAAARPQVYLPGGQVTGTEPSITGARAADQLKQFNFDMVFLGAAGLSDRGRFYDYSPEDTEIKKVLIAAARRRVMLIDSSKFSRSSVALICELGHLDVLISDAPPPPPLQELIEAAGVEFILTG